MTDENVTIRPAREGDAEGLAQVYVESAEHHQRLDPSMYVLPDYKQMVARYRRRLPPPDDAQILVAESADGEILGWVEVLLKPANGEPRMSRDSATAEVDIGVVEEMRGSGIGSKLMDAAEVWAVEHGAELMVVDTHVANVDAIRFYQERHGWRTTGLVLAKRPQRRKKKT
jgi:GNAT superfamily N-acetyltransferase